MTNIQRNHRIMAETLRPPVGNTEVAIEFEGFELIVRGDYEPSENATYFYPGCHVGFDVTEVYLIDSAIDISDLFTGRPLAIAVLEQIRKEAAECETT